MRTLPAESVQCCVTSPPYYGLRSYSGGAAEIGQEESPDAYVAKLVDVFRKVRRVLRPDGTVWLNLGDSYASQGGAHGGRSDNQTGVGAKKLHIEGAGDQKPRKPPSCVKSKDLLMIPARVALALQTDGWWLRSDIIWHKPNPMPESVTDRPTSAHEHVFLLTKAERYFYDAAAIAEEVLHPNMIHKSSKIPDGAKSAFNGNAPTNLGRCGTSIDGTRNARNVWTIASQPFSGAHFATMPPDLAERCIKAGTKPGDTVLDPFGGAGTTALVADRLGRSAILCELNPEYAKLARERISDDAGLFAKVAAE